MIKLALAFIIFLSSGAYGQVTIGVQHGLDKQVEILVEYLVDEKQSLSIDEAIHSSYSLTTNKQCFNLDSNIIWYKVTVANPLDSPAELFLHNNRGNLSKQVILYDVVNEKVIRTHRYDFFDKHVGDKLLGSVIVYPFTTRPNLNTTIYIKNESLAYQCLDVEIHDKKTSVQALINNDFYSNIIIVVLFTMAIYNLLLYSFIRRIEFVFYTLYLVNAAIGLAYYYGVIFHHFQMYGEYVYWLNLTAILGSLFLVLFVQEIIDTRKKYQTIHILLNSVLILSVLDILVAVILSLSLASQLVFIIFAYSFVVLGYMAVVLFKDKNPLIGMFCLAYLAYMIGMAIVLLMFMGALPLNEFTFHSSGIGIIVEALLFSYLLHHRFRLLMQQKVKAEGANKRKTRFLASASHDLRQPVHALELFSESLGNEKISQKGHETLSYMKDCIASLNDLLSSLLDISRLDAGIVEPHFENIDVSQIISRVVNSMQGEAKRKGLNLRVYGKSLWVKSDSTLLENSIRNLIINAVKYTNEGKVLIACRSRMNEVWIEVWDSGIGIAEEELSNIFEEFYQVNNADRDQRQGLGLGLSIITREMDILGHMLSLQSREGRGTMARIKLQRVYLEMPHIEQTAAVRFDRLENKKVLIIDDEESILIATQSLVSNWSCVVETASNFEEASAICKRFIPDLIISDFRLRDHVTGIDVIEQLRLQLGHKVPAILITGDTAPDRLQQAKESELMLLHKPVKPVKLKVAMNMVLNTE